MTGGLKTKLTYLPEGKWRELEFVVELIRAGFAEALSRRSAPRFRSGKILKIVLFGSYAHATGRKIRPVATSRITTFWTIMAFTEICEAPETRHKPPSAPTPYGLSAEVDAAVVQ